MKRFLTLALLIIAAAFLTFAASDTPQTGPLMSPRSEIDQLQAKIAEAKALGQTPDPQWTARIQQLLPLIETPQPAVAPVAPQASPNDILFHLPAAIPSERPNTPLEQQIRAVESQLFTSSAAPVITPALKDQLNTLYDQRPENHPMGQPIQRPDTPLEQQIRQIEEQFSHASGPEAMALKQQISTLYEQRPENRVGNPLDQGGDNCSTATVITTLPFHDTGTTVGRVDDFQPSCGYAAGAPDVIYQLTAPHTGPYKISLCGSSYDTELYVRWGDACPGTAPIACSDDDCGFNAQVTPTLMGGRTYWIIVDGYANASGAYVLNVIDLSGDDCSSAIQIPELPYTDVSSTDSLTNNWNTASNCDPTNAPDRIYTFTAIYTGSHTVSLCGSSYDTELELRTGGSCPGTTQVACNDDNCGLQSSLTANLTAGTQYWIIVDGYSTHSGAYVLNVTDACSEPCQSFDIPECTEWGVHCGAIADCNGGCDNWGTDYCPYLFSLVLPWQTYCGRGFTYYQWATDWRDTDWYQLSLSEPCSLQVGAISEFPLQSYIVLAPCPVGNPIAQSSSDPCVLLSYSSPGCLAAGTYYIVFRPSVFTGLETPKNYRMVVLTYPCSGCVVDGTVLAPASVTGNTCGAVNNCSLRPSEDQTWRVNIPRESDWTFSLCGTSPNWDSYIYLTSQCCGSGSIIAQDDDGCGGVGVSVIHCAHLVAGSYYLTVEGWSSSSCGAYTLNITECLGRCCGATDSTCTYVSASACQALNGRFSEGVPCSAGCYIRPSCLSNSTFSQQPFVPNEGWMAWPSDQALREYGFEDFSGMSAAIGTIRFWGLQANGNNNYVACSENPMPFHIRFFNNSGGNVGTQVASFNVTLSGTPGYTYELGDNHPLMQYSTTLNPPVNLSAGWVSVVGDGDSTCNFYWLTAYSGNSIARFGSNSNGSDSGPFYYFDFAMCFGPQCLTADSLTIMYVDSIPANRLDFHCPQSCTYRIFATTDHNAIYPNTFVQVAVGTVPPGHYYWYDLNVSPLYRRYVIVQDCGSEAPPFSSSSFGQFVRVDPTTSAAEPSEARK